jgi:tRNA (adenine57-N1/adenine58-N1)-methyltransferase
MVELYARRLEVRRERIGLQEEGLRGVNSTPATVDEAVGRLRDLEERMKMFHKAPEADLTSKQERLENIRAALADRKLYKEGRLVHRSEPELKTHTSYLVFAVLPMKWTESDEERVIKAAKGFKGVQPVVKKSKKQLKCEAKSNATVEA